MPIDGITQPEIIEISPTLRLKKFSGEFDFALPWYSDPVVLKMSEGENAKPYTLENLNKTYSYLNANGELYWIEELRGDKFVPIGDVTMWQEDMPIALGSPDVRGRGIGKAVVCALIDRARSLGWHELRVENIFSYNEASRRLFTSCGFAECAKTENGASYKLVL